MMKEKMRIRKKEAEKIDQIVDGSKEYKLGS